MLNKLHASGFDDYPWEDDEGHAWESKSMYIQQKYLGFCSCGDPDSVMIYVKEMFEKFDSHNWSEYDDLSYMFFAYWANEQGFAEHGSTARCSWLTSEGKALLHAINECLTTEGGASKDE